MAPVTGFQQDVNNELPPAIAGDFAGANIRSSVNAGPGAFVAGLSGVLIGTFAWGDPVSGLADSYYKPNSALGFVHREMNGLITNFLGISTQRVVAGNMATLLNQGDFWGLFGGSATVGQKVYVNPQTGALSGNVTGQSVVANSTAASLATTGVLTVGATLTGTLAVGQVVTGAGIPQGSYISAQLTGSAGSTGTYQLTNIDGTAFPTVGSETVNFWGLQETPFYVASAVQGPITTTASLAATGVLTVTVTNGVIAPGMYLSGAGVTNAFQQILQQITGTTGSTGTYLTTLVGQTIGSQTFTLTQGQLGKISSWGP